MEGSEERVRVLKQDPIFLKFSAILPSSGAIVDDIREEIPESTVSAYFGPKASKSGWKYAKHTSPEVASAIYDLWTRVYDDVSIPNKEITLQFARGVILEQTQPVNWAEFALGRYRYRQALRVSKKSSGKDDQSRDVAKVSIGGVKVLGKRRTQVQSRTDYSTHEPVKLTLKDLNEDLAMGKTVAVGKVRGGRGKGDDLGPSWMESDLGAMETVIDNTERLLEECRKELQESSVEVEDLEGQVRRATIILSDRLVMLEDHERELSKICDQEAVLRNKIAEKEALLCKSGGSVELSSGLGDEKLLSDDISLSKAHASRTAAHCSSVVVGCRADLASVECRLLESSQRRENVLKRVSGLEVLLVGMHEQLRRMKEGSGHALFPRPLANNPEKPVSSVHILNACPLCGFWYKANNFVALCCGHTYHPFCLSQHARSSSVCSFQDCGQDFSSETMASIGIRPVETRSTIDVPVKIEGGSSHVSQKLELQTLGKIPALAHSLKSVE